jgi:CMP-N,N'-diacetyllegionaminic acid synthase
VTYTALVAARGGSKRVLQKNTRPFGDTTLLEIKLAQLTRIPIIDRVVLSSEDPEILSLARQFDCDAMPRDSYFASDAVVMSEVYAYMASQCPGDVIIYANCTSPMVRDCTIIELIGDYERGLGTHDSVNSGSLIREFLFEDNKPVNYDPGFQPRSQDLPELVALNFAVSIIDRQLMIERRNVVGSTPNLRIIDEVEGVDIDTPLDFAFAEFLFREKGGGTFLTS